MSTRDADDRREYYRIEDTLALEFRPAGAVEDSLESEPGATLFSLLSDLHLMDYESQHLLRHISERDRTLANYLKVMNKRIDLLGQVMVQSLLKEIGEPRKVSLSEGASASTTTALCRSASCSSCAWSCCRRVSASNCGPG